MIFCTVHKDLTDCAFGCYNERLVCRKPVHVFVHIALGANIIHELSPDIVAVLDGPRTEAACVMENSTAWVEAVTKRLSCTVSRTLC